MKSAPTVMVSSTFYDLKQVRTDLHEFIVDELGYIPLLSELPSFPVNPNDDTIENCRNRVKENADILILVIGGRYGSINDKTEKSITNLEYLAALNKGIPIYVFIEKTILNILPIWKKNLSGDFSNVVDTEKLFEFVDSIYNKERVWVFPFETAQDIIKSLRIQFAYLFNDSLKVRNRLGGTELPEYFHKLTSKSLQLALEKPDAWEYRLFFQSFIDEVEKRGDLFREYSANLKIETSEFVKSEEAVDWMQTRLHELKGISSSAEGLINEHVQKAFGKPGEPGNEEGILWVSSMLGKILEKTIKWAMRINCAHVESPFDSLVPKLAKFVEDMIPRFMMFPKENLNKLETALSDVRNGNPQDIVFKLTMDISNVDEFNKAVKKLEAYFNSI
ncbi:MAG: DUF4062 domain-containing protein [candidate division Zixibacteria bacterium]